MNKKELRHLAELARIELTEGETEKLLADLSDILRHFEELQAVDTSAVAAMTGGTMLENALRDDEAALLRLPGERAIEAFPDTRDGFLEVPPVFV